MKETKTYRAGYSRYKTVKILPAEAMTISEYCEKRGCTNPYIYELYRRKKADFDIVIFKGINFVIPLTIS
jgi:hypothetical protein